MRAELGELKRDVFYRLMDLAGRVFVLVNHSDRVEMGRRGFTEAEMERGLVLVFNDKMQFLWDETGIHASLSFSAVKEKCFIPHEDILAVYSPDLKIQLSADPQDEEPEKKGAGPPTVEKKGAGKKGAGKEGVGTPDGKVIRVDFLRKEEDEEDDEPA
jgi:hypothetical protein